MRKLLFALAMVFSVPAMAQTEDGQALVNGVVSKLGGTPAEKPAPKPKKWSTPKE